MSVLQPTVIGSEFLTRLFLWIGLAALIAISAVFFGTTSEAGTERFVCETATRWRAEHADEKDLIVLKIDAHFDEKASAFYAGEGAIVLSAGLTFVDEQTLVATAAYPPPVRTIEVDGIVNHVWEYAGVLRSRF